MNKIITIVSIALFAPFITMAAPSITLNGGSVSIQQGSSYSELGYSASSPVDGDITSLVSVISNILSNIAGNYSVHYSVTDSTEATADAVRSVSVISFGAIGNPCAMNGTCPCPMSADPFTGNRAEWKACVMARYPKTSDGSTLVCRLRALFPGETKPVCADKQEGFGEMLISPTGVETNIF